MSGTVRLEAEGLDPFELTDTNGFAIETVDLGFPTIRAASEERTDIDGEDDRTSRFGARAVVLSGNVVPTATLNREQVLDRLKAFLRPDLRPYLYVDLEGSGTERRIRLRGDLHSGPISRPGSVTVTVGWRGPDGILEAVDETETTVDATPDVEAGLTFPLTFPMTFPDGSAIGTVEVTNSGNVDALGVYELHGPCTGPQIENQTTGGLLSFPELTLTATEWLELDVRARTIRLNGLANQSRSNRLDFDVSSWFSIASGVNVLRFFPLVDAGGAYALIRHRHAYL